MISKIIHYCWFGGSPLPTSAIKCLESWKRFLPNYEIWAWCENVNFNVHDNISKIDTIDTACPNHSTLVDYADKVMTFDVNIIPYTKEAYMTKKYAFVSDYARFWILFNYGGVYFDTDVEIIKPLDDIIANGPFMGIEVEATPQKAPLINPGLGIGAPARLLLYEQVLKYYEHLHFLGEDGLPNPVTVVTHTTNVLVNYGLKNTNKIQEVANINIYPQDYFNPLNDNTGVLMITKNTRSIHWYTKTWEKKRSPIISWVTKRIHRYFGVNSLQWIRKIIKK